MALFITIEGGDGSGKSTLLEKICRLLLDKNIKFIATREPGGTPLGEEIRKILIHPFSERMEPMTELFLYEAARSEHVKKVIAPALNKNFHVICDRFIHSSVAYQGHGRGLGEALVTQMNQTATGTVKPDLVIWLKLSPQEAKLRSHKRGSQDRFDEEKETFYQKIFNAYSQMAQTNPKQFITLDASQDPEAVFHQLVHHPQWKELFGKLT